MIDLNEVGAHVAPAGSTQVRFGVYLPEIAAEKGYSVVVRIIHELDQFTPEVPPKDVPLTFDASHPMGLWSAAVELSALADATSNFGKPGRYRYRYRLYRAAAGSAPRVITSWFTDPFAMEAGPARLSGFTIGDPRQPTEPFAWTDGAYRTPALDDLVVYELQVEEFNSTFDGVVDRIDYLKGLGVNCLELMPIADVPQAFDWGYGPLHYFAPEERWGGSEGLKRLIDACHAEEIAVILDVVYQHASADFAYCSVYKDSGEAGPMGSFPDGMFGPQFTWHGFPFTQEYVRTANKHWLDEYHVDGFRYDNVPGFYDGPMGDAYANVVYQTYQDSMGIARFADSAGYSRIVQCAEQLDDPRGVLRSTYSNATWQDQLLGRAESLARSGGLDDSFAHLLDPAFSGYPATRDFNGKEAPVAPFQYFESHDHSYFVHDFGEVPGIGGPGDVSFGDRSVFYKLQPYAIALYTCQGIPMLWQGQEFAENYTIPGGGSGRISFRRSMHWEYFYDEQGQPLIRLYRRLGTLRRALRSLRSRELYYFYQDANLTGGAIAYQRHAPADGADPEEYALVFLNFSDAEQTLWVPFPVAGSYRERIDENVSPRPHPDVVVANAREYAAVRIPSNYGLVYVL